MKCCCQLGCPWLFRQSTRLRVDAGGYQPLSSPNTSRSRILILTICWACYSPPPRGIQKFGASLTSAPSWLSCARAWVSEACPCIPSRRNSQAARSLKSHPIMRRPGETLSTWWLSTGPTARRVRPAVGSSTVSSKHRRRPSNLNCLDRSRFPSPPRLRVDGRRSGCWHRQKSKDANSRLVDARRAAYQTETPAALSAHCQALQPSYYILSGLSSRRGHIGAQFSAGNIASRRAAAELCYFGEVQTGLWDGAAIPCECGYL